MLGELIHGYIDNGSDFFYQDEDGSDDDSWGRGSL
jgi:hypothetical protein